MQQGREVFAVLPAGIGRFPGLERKDTQMKKHGLLFSVVISAALAGCATQEGVQPKWTLKQSNFAPIKPQTTKEEVERLVGKPVLTMTFPRKPEEVWDYRYMNGVETWGAAIHFDMQGRTTYTEFYPDTCPMRPAPCR
jgi:outer membrane protein assembly factor BamE (lipoprotein component of BamABCDE complex)